MNANGISQTATPAGALSQAQATPVHRILVAEDDGDIRRLNSEALQQSGYHVDVVEDGAAAWETLQRSSYSLLVTDNEMPRMTGVDLLKKLHAAQTGLPVIMATAAYPEFEFTRSPWLKPAATLIKPYTIDELVLTVAEVLHAIGSRRQAVTPPAQSNRPSTDDWQKLLSNLKKSRT